MEPLLSVQDEILTTPFGGDTLKQVCQPQLIAKVCPFPLAWLGNGEHCTLDNLGHFD